MSVPRAATLLVANAHLITAAPEGPLHIPHGWMLVENGVITDLGAGPAPRTSPQAAFLDCGGRLIGPGFVSSHSHLFTSGLRGLASDVSLYAWAETVIGATRRATPEDIYWATVHGSFDFLNAGVTTAFDFTDPREPWSTMVDGRRSEPDADRLRPVDYILRQIDAKIDAGLRFVSATRPDSDIGTFDDVMTRFEPTVDHLRSLDRRFALDAAVMGGVQWADNPEAAAHEAALMRRFGIVNQAHFLESPEAVDHQRAKFDLYEASGAVGPDFIFGHFVQTTDRIIERTAAAGAHMSWQATANGRLGSGVPRIRRMREAGIEIGLGLDDQACSDLADPWQNMRMALYGLRADERDPTALAVADALHFQTLGAARIIGVADRVGSLEPGKFADFVVVDPAAPDTGPLWDPVGTYVLACGLRNLKGVYVGGARVSDGMVPADPLARRAGEEIRLRAERLGPEVQA